MAHKDLVGGTVYEKDGGADLVGGTVYKKDFGKTVVGGTVYEVGFAKPLISFTIKEYNSGTKTYYAEDGMTWGEWVDSEYNPADYQNHKIYEIWYELVYNVEYSLSVMVSNNYTFPRSTELITANGVYELAKD